MAIWYRVCFEDAKVHLVPATFLKAMLADLGARGVKLKDFSKSGLPDDEKQNPRRVTAWGIDAPGMCRTDRPIERFAFNGLDLEIPSEDIAYFVSGLTKLSARYFGKRPYYKLHGFMQCMVLTPVQYERLLAILKLVVFDAERRATEFYADHATPSEILTQAQPLAAGVDLGGHKQDRFAHRHATTKA